MRQHNMLYNIFPHVGTTKMLAQQKCWYNKNVGKCCMLCGVGIFRNVVCCMLVWDFIYHMLGYAKILVSKLKNLDLTVENSDGIEITIQKIETARNKMIGQIKNIF